eukprot:258426-Rhodomonas_salina.1
MAMQQGKKSLSLPVVCSTAVLLSAIHFGAWNYGPAAMASTFLAMCCSWMYLLYARSNTPPPKSELDDVEYVVKKTHEFSEELPKGVKAVETILRNDDMANLLGQRGPTCAAASVANALNVVFQHKKTDEDAFKVRDAMAVYLFIFGRKRAEAVGKLSKLVKMDASCLLPYIASEKVCMAARARNKTSLVTVLLEMLPAELCPETEPVLHAVKTALKNVDQPSSALVVDRVRRLVKAEWAVAKLEGRWKLPSGKVLPSTAPIGNVNVGIACKSLALLRQKKDVRVTSFMGLSKLCRHIVSKKDSEEDKERQWEEIKLAISNKDASLIFHLHNHYALISGWRCVQVQTSSGPVTRKQLLTARTGQDLVHWVDWDGDHHARSKVTGEQILRKSVRTTLLSWKGHKIMLVEQSKFTSKRAVVDPEVKKVVEGVVLDREEAEEAAEEDGMEEDFAGDMAGGSSADEAES